MVSDAVPPHLSMLQMFAKHFGGFDSMFSKKCCTIGESQQLKYQIS